VLATALSTYFELLGGVRDNERGASLVEYALLLALIAVVCIAATSALGNTVSSSFGDASSSITN